MNRSLAMLIACVLVATSAAAVDCGRAVSPIDKTLCSQPDLGRLDAALNKMYTGLRGQATPKARGELLQQQRAWIAQRDRVCASGAADCLRTLYWARMDDFQALEAAAKVSDGPLTEATPVVVRGAWKASAVQDSLGPGHASDAEVKQSLTDADLPAIGASIHATPGQVCTVPGDCETVAFTRTTLGTTEGGPAIGSALKLPTGTPTLVGDNGAKQSGQLTLVPRTDGSVWAIFGLCGPRATHCRNAVEVWTPLGPNTAMGH